MPVFSYILRDAQKNKSKFGFDKSRKWFRDRAKMVTQVQLPGLINNNPNLNKSVVQPGQMYLFAYDAKHKDKLPYWDRFPLIFPIEMYEDSFLGINLHYLPHRFRAQLMDALYSIMDDTKYDEKTKIAISYSLLKSSSKFRYFEPCVKKYLKSHVKSNFLLIPANEWDIALFMPLERFTVDKSIVFRDSTKRVQG